VGVGEISVRLAAGLDARRMDGVSVLTRTSPSTSTSRVLRIDFARTIRADEYDGLRPTTMHQDTGELDAVALRFEDHKTFDHRNAARGRSPRESGYGTIYEFRDRPDWAPWEGAHSGGLRAAIEQYPSVWFPSVWKRPAPSRPSGRTARGPVAADRPQRQSLPLNLRSTERQSLRHSPLRSRAPICVSVLPAAFPLPSPRW
jgi:hypothetical protein